MFAMVNNVPLHYEIDGEGMPCMVMAMIGSPFYERSFSAVLRRYLRFIFVEPRAAGRSGGAADDVTFATIAADMDALRVHLGITQMIVAGQSANGFMALEYALRYPKHAAGVVLIGTPPKAGWQEACASFQREHLSDERRAILEERRQRATPEALAALPPDEARRVHASAESPLYWYDPLFDAAPLYAGGVIQQDFLARYFGVLLDGYDRTARFHEITCPVFIAHGAYDFVVPPTLWTPAIENLPDATFRLFEHSAHFPHYEEQAQFDGALAVWLRGMVI